MRQFIKSFILLFLLGLSINLKAANTSCDPQLQLLEATLKDATHGPTWKAFLEDAASAGGLGGKTFEMLQKINSIAVRSNQQTMLSIRTALARGNKNVGDILTHAGGVLYINENTIIHIFRGDGFNAGRHHISALIEDQTIKLSHKVDLGDGFYKASLKKGDLTMNDKSFWPDEMDEFEIVDAIKAAYLSNPIANIESTITFIGTWQGKNIKIVKEGGIIKSAFLD
jgi:hypothetical protein